MTQLNQAIKDHLESIISSTDLEKQVFFQVLRKGEISKHQFLKTQMEFSHMVAFFNRPMAMMVANIPNAQKRMAIVGNLWEEHGQGVPEKIHGKTILTLIERLGGNVDDINEDSYTTNVKIFNNSLKSIAASENYQFSAAVFAGIERLFVEISTEICDAIVKNNWLPLDRVTHYALHKEIDIQHAEDFLKVVNNDWDTPEHQKSIKDGIKFGIELFLNVYSGLYNNIKSKN
jgi:pyrroloquinoline-quinone synthase